MPRGSWYIRLLGNMRKAGRRQAEKLEINDLVMVKGRILVLDFMEEMIYG